MGERFFVIEGLSLKYDGLFSISELYKLIDEWFQRHGYEKVEKRNAEQVLETGKNIELVIEPEKFVSDYLKFTIRLKILVEDAKEVRIEQDGIKKNMNKGAVDIGFQGFLITDWEGRWEQKPSYFFWRTIFDKFVFKSHIKEYEGKLATDVHQLHNELKAFLNLYRAR